ncbi:MAG: hypothetical protein DWI30_06745 [Chloroflexi bacterium]|nr:MAG: hypothetical protein DWI30_06745 [Chloroflexota bacterium]
MHSPDGCAGGANEMAKFAGIRPDGRDSPMDAMPVFARTGGIVVVRYISNLWYKEYQSYHDKCILME